MKLRATHHEKRVRFQVVAPPGAAVYVAGTFNGWNPREFRMNEAPFRLKANSEDAIYAGVVTVLPGEYEYKFIVNDQWMADPGNQERRPDGFGTFNSVLRVQRPHRTQPPAATSAATK